MFLNSDNPYREVPTVKQVRYDGRFPVLTAAAHQIVITAASTARIDWGDAFAQMEIDRDELDPLTVTNTWAKTV
jgi:hypothetical protein